MALTKAGVTDCSGEAAVGETVGDIFPLCPGRHVRDPSPPEDALMDQCGGRVQGIAEFGAQ